MDRWQGLMARIREYNPQADLELLKKGAALLAHAGPPQRPPLFPDTPYDPAMVAGILADLRLDLPAIVAAILFQPYVEESIPRERLSQELGEEIYFLLQGVGRIHGVATRATTEQQAEDFRRLILVMARDLRVIFVRFAICLQQMRAMVAKPAAGRLGDARQVLDIFAPLAHRLGLHWIKSELEDLAFQIVDPEEFVRIREMVAVHRKGGRDVVQKVVSHLERMLAENGVKGRVSGREKHLYSIREKLERKNASLDELYDLIAYRIIVAELNDCYTVLGLIHNELTPIPGRFKDYIALPKSNGYQSLHTAVIGPFGNRIEIQIRSEKMHRVAEDGVAAHWLYKDGEGRKRGGGRGWIKQLLALNRQADDGAEFLENVKVDLFPDEIYVFTPRGDIVTLPKGATPVDFAYSVHSQVGDRCQGARVNGRMVPLKTALSPGDQVEIVTGKNRRPNPHWLEFVVSNKSRYHINRWVKAERREETIHLGRELLERELRKADPPMALNEKVLARAVALLEVESPEELLHQIGASRVTPGHVANLLHPEGRKEPVRSEEETVYRKKTAPPPGSGLRLQGLLPDMVIHVGRCCNPVPGEAVVGIVTTGRGITVHAVACPNLGTFSGEPERWIEDVELAEAPGRTYGARLRVMVSNQRGVLVLVSQAVTEAGAGITQAKTLDRDRDPCVLLIDVDVSNKDHLEKVMQAIRARSVVHGVERVRG